jgi:hypothetical protein
MNMRIVGVVLAGAFALNAAVAQAPFDRASDKNIENLLEAVGDKNADFRDALDRDFRTSVVRGDRGEVDVEAYLDDLEDAAKDAADRFSDEYAASAEVRNLLMRGAPMHSYVREHPELRGASEWDQLAGDLNRLAQAYGASFPLAEDANVRRIGDGELRDSLGALSDIGEQAHNALRRASRDTPALAAQGGIESLAAFGETAEALEARISRNQPATAEARQLQALATKLDGLLGDTAVPATVKDMWKPAKDHIARITQAFGL